MAVIAVQCWTNQIILTNDWDGQGPQSFLRLPSWSDAGFTLQRWTSIFTSFIYLKDYTPEEQKLKQQFSKKKNKIKGPKQRRDKG